MAQQESHTGESGGPMPRSAGKGKSSNGAHKDAATTMAEFFQNMDPQKLFSLAPGKTADFGPLFNANIEMMRTFDGMFQKWAAGLSARNQERIHTLEECAKCDNQADVMKLQNDCLQKLTKHWMADSQKLGGIFFDAMGKAYKENNSRVMSAMKQAAEGGKTP